MYSVAEPGLIERRRERVFLVLAGVFLCAMCMLNIIGITKFVELGPLSLAVGVLPYPLTFLCTDLISELYGRARAAFMVTVGLGLNIFILAVLALADGLPPIPQSLPWQLVMVADGTALPNGEVVGGQVPLFHLLYAASSGAVMASMLAYILAQYCDVWLYHFWRRLTKGRHLWLRNNASTLISQLVDSVVVISITFGAAWLGGRMATATLLVLMGSNYLFKMLVALADTLPMYLCVHFLRRWLRL